MRRVVLESPFAGEVINNRSYAQRCLADCLDRGEAPLASHLLYPQVLADELQADRALGISVGHAWIERADALVVYTDRGISEGMKAGIRAAELRKIPVEYRTLNGAKGDA